MNVYCLYFPNGKRYVGVETRPGRRISEHSRCVSLYRRTDKSPQYVHVAINKHGWENVKWRYLATHCTNEDAWALEKFFIRTMCLQDREQGYNRSEGGKSNAAGVCHTQERIDKTNATRRKNGTHIPHHMHTPEMRAKSLATRMENQRLGKKRKAVSPESYAKRRHPRNSGQFKQGSSPHNKGKPHPSKSKGKICLPSGPNGELRFFRPEQLI